MLTSRVLRMTAAALLSVGAAAFSVAVADHGRNVSGIVEARHGKDMDDLVFAADDVTWGK
ncbi:hypothetical protein [Streptomyces thermoviolaceus]|uniref:hypothetical protein n=1 Tax=Streptomyces thermoviolaceus TaxID=1952 RepID=UPI0016731405|nr:hypothetical protein [Streptomyces thermoviolaceus]GGV79689.1 hypothetical protein GCM10010499_41410 [Streptomyces thermoviolaceus subsp. apingens]